MNREEDAMASKVTLVSPDEVRVIVSVLNHDGVPAPVLLRRGRVIAQPANSLKVRRIRDGEAVGIIRRREGPECTPNATSGKGGMTGGTQANGHGRDIDGGEVRGAILAVVRSSHVSGVISSSYVISSLAEMDGGGVAASGSDSSIRDGRWGGRGVEVAKTRLMGQLPE